MFDYPSQFPGKEMSFLGTSILIRASGLGVNEGVLALSGDSSALLLIPRVRIS